MKRAATSFLIVLLAFSTGTVRADVLPEKKVLVLGIDGMDPDLLQTYIDEGKMPHFKKMIDEGGDFKKLITSEPPQSPVAWSNFAVGANPGKHGIFDFIHRSPETMAPYLSITETKGSDRSIQLGDWQIPLAGGTIRNLRKGTPYWEHLCEQAVIATICQIPANYPPTSVCKAEYFKTLSGMGTPDLLGTQGTFSFYTSEEVNLKEVIGGGQIYPVQVADGKVSAELYGPPHPYKNPEKFEGRKEALALKLPFVVWVDEENERAKVEIKGHEFFLNKGEFSDWVDIKFDVIPLIQSVPGIVRFYLKEVSPNFKLYVSPLNIDPSNPAMPISQPPSYARELFEAVGYFYTVNMPPDTKALEHEVFSDDDFLKQLGIVFDEEKKRLDFELGRFTTGVFFHYFGVLDQLSHTFWRYIDPEHPLYTVEGNRQYGRVIENYYIEFDRILGSVLSHVDADTLVMVMSDHGFSSFRRGVNLNTILLHRGFITLTDPAKQEESEFFSNVDWRQTKAYNLGINSIYINLDDRERFGSVSAGDYDAVVEEIKAMLLNYKDPKTGLRPIKSVWRREEIYHGPYLDHAPDLIVGYDHGYRASWDTILGEMPKEEVVDNLSRWSGDHTIDFNLVPGILLANRKVAKDDPALVDLAPTLLEYFGIMSHPDMDGESIF